ncbi:MAG: hypothetical protein II305_06120 [Clostridia bacterium]|nr:hypothetical protein [Clostridia bacterium]MBQ5716183.1 hypothetical protein [Clostridia bacterium]
MTDNEIVKGLECCIGDTDGKDCFGCPLYEIDDCQAHLNLAALDLINRQKAENERLTDTLNATIAGQETLQRYIITAKAKAYKEFAERLKSRLITVTYINFDDIINNLLKEMVGNNNA